MIWRANAGQVCTLSRHEKENTCSFLVPLARTVSYTISRKCILLTELLVFKYWLSGGFALLFVYETESGRECGKCKVVAAHRDAACCCVSRFYSAVAVLDVHVKRKVQHLAIKYSSDDS